MDGCLLVVDELVEILRVVSSAKKTAALPTASAADLPLLTEELVLPAAS